MHWSDLLLGDGVEDVALVAVVSGPAPRPRPVCTGGPELGSLHAMAERQYNQRLPNCVVAANLAERAWVVMQRGEPYQIRDTDGRPVSVDEAKAIIADRWTVPEDVRRRRRGLQARAGKAPQQVVARHAKPSAERAATRRPSPEPMVPEAPAPIKDVLPAIAERLGIPS